MVFSPIVPYSTIVPLAPPLFGVAPSPKDVKVAPVIWIKDPLQADIG